MPSSATGRSSRTSATAGTGRSTGTGRGSGVSPALPTGTVTATIATSSTVTSAFSPAVTWVNVNTDSNKNAWRTAGWNNVKTNLSPLIAAQSAHLFPFANTQAWVWTGTGSAPSAAGGDTPNNLSGETNNSYNSSWARTLEAFREVKPGGDYHMKVFMPEWWMKHTVDNAGSVTNATYADRDIADSGRLKSSKAAEWKLLVRTAASRAMAAPYNVRWFSVHNELKSYWGGYLSPARWDVTYNDGAGDTPMGYGYFYKLTVDALLDAASDNGLAASDIYVGGPYNTIRGVVTAGQAVASNHPYASILRNRPWGYMGKNGATALEEFLDVVVAHSLKLDFLSVDGADYNTDNLYTGITDDWTNGQRWHDWHTYFRGILGDKGLDANMPIIWEEFYRYPRINTSVTTPTYRAALKADLFIDFVNDGVKWGMSWGPFATDTFFEVDGNGGQLTTPTSTGGTVQAFGTVCGYFNNYFGPGTAVYAVTASDATKLKGLATGSKVLLINKTSGNLDVSVDGGAAITLSGYETRLVDR